MIEKKEYIEFRVAYPGHPYVALIGGRDERYGFQRLFDPFRVRRERLPNGTQVVVHHLPLMDALYEIEHVVEGHRERRYVATLEGDITVHALMLHEAEAIAEGSITVSELLRRRAPVRVHDPRNVKQERGL